MEPQHYEAKTKEITDKAAKITENALEQRHVKGNSQDQLLRSKTCQANVILSFNSISSLVFKWNSRAVTDLDFSNTFDVVPCLAREIRTRKIGPEQSDEKRNLKV